MKYISLMNIYPASIGTVAFLYDLLAEREPHQNISHREMPSFEQHQDFVDSHPYKAWYLICADGDPIGATYLTKQNEIGIFIKKDYQGNGYGGHAIRQVMKMHPAEQFYANIAPGNTRSIAMFDKLGFELIQFTFVKDNVK